MKLLILLFLLQLSAGTSCKDDSDCLDYNTCENDVCTHKALIPIAPIEYGGAVLFIFFAAIANSAGNGGSSIILGLLMLLFNFDTQKIPALTIVFTAGGAAVVTFTLFNQKHPTRKRPVINYDAIMLLMSPLLFGIQVGNIIRPAFPSWLIITILVCIVSFLLYDTIKRFLRLYRKEKAQLDPPKQIEEAETKRSGIRDPTSSDSSKEIKNFGGERYVEVIVENPDKDNDKRVNSYEAVHEKHYENNSSESEKKSEIEDKPTNQHIMPDGTTVKKIQEIETKEGKLISRVNLAYFLFVLGFCIGFSVIQGSATSPSKVGIPYCSQSYFALYTLYFFVMILLNILVVIYLIRKTYVYESLGYNFDEHDTRWSLKNCSLVSAASIVIGISISLLGLGAGNFIGTIMLTLGARPEVSTASSSFAIFISSIITAAQYLIAKAVDMPYAALLFICSAVGALVGILFIRRYFVKRKIASILILFLAIIFLCSLIVMPTSGIISAIRLSASDNYETGFKKVCQ